MLAALKLDDAGTRKADMLFSAPTYPLHQFPCECSPRLLMGAPVPGRACMRWQGGKHLLHKHKVRTCCKRLQMASGRSTPAAAWSRSAPGIVQLLEQSARRTRQHGPVQLACSVRSSVQHHCGPRSDANQTVPRLGRPSCSKAAAVAGTQTGLGAQSQTTVLQMQVVTGAAASKRSPLQ